MVFSFVQYHKHQIIILLDQKKLKGNEYLIKNDYLKIRNNYRLFALKTKKELKKIFSKNFQNINIGLLENDYFGLKEKMFIVV